MSTLTFEDLHEDIVQNVLKYLPFKDRIQLELVDKNFRYNLGQVWKRQSKLAIRVTLGPSIFDIYFEDWPSSKVTTELCMNSGHRIPECDVIGFIVDRTSKFDSTK